MEVVKRKERGMKLNLPPKVEKLVWVSVTSFCKISFLVMHLMPYYAKTGRSWPLIAWLYSELYYIYIKFAYVYYGVCNCFRIKFSKFCGIKNTWSMVDQTILMTRMSWKWNYESTKTKWWSLTNTFNGFIISFWIVYATRFINQPLIEMRQWTC